MVPPRLPLGDYELTLRSRSPDGTIATSKQRVVVALAETESSSGVNRSRAEVPFNVPETPATDRLSLDRATRSSQARLLFQPPLHIAKRQDVAVSELPRRLARVEAQTDLAFRPICLPTPRAGGCRPMRDVKTRRSVEHENTDGERSSDQLGTIDGKAMLRGCPILS